MKGIFVTWESHVLAATIERFKVTFTLNGKCAFVPRDQIFTLIAVYCLLLLHKNESFHASFIHENCSGQFLSAYFLKREILNLNLTFAVNVTLNLSNISLRKQPTLSDATSGFLAK